MQNKKKKSLLDGENRTMNFTTAQHTPEIVLNPLLELIKNNHVTPHASDLHKIYKSSLHTFNKNIQSKAKVWHFSLFLNNCKQQEIFSFTVSTIIHLTMSLQNKTEE